MKNFNIIKHRKIYYLFSASLILIGIVSFILFGLNLSRDFQGGSLLEIKFKEEPKKELLEKNFQDLGIQKLEMEFQKEDRVIFKFGAVDEKKHQEILKHLQKQVGKDQEIKELRFETIGPVIGKEFRRKAIYAVIFACLAIVAFVAYAFRKVSEPIASWKYGVAAVAALMHDVFIIFSIFVVLGRFLNIEIDALFITALLTVLGFSVNDTIVVFDRIRENLIKAEYDSFEDCVNQSVNQTLMRSINTSLTTLFVLLAVLFFGGETIFWFVLALTCGVVVGTYSSIFLASPMLVDWERMTK